MTVLNVLMRTAVEWKVIDRAVFDQAVTNAETEAGFYDFEQFERRVEAAAGELQAQPVILLGGEARLRCGETIGLFAVANRVWVSAKGKKRAKSTTRPDAEEGGCKNPRP